VRNPFRRKNNKADDVPVYNADDLKRNRENDDYRNNKKVADPMFDFIALVVKVLPFICLFAVGFLAYYYIWSPNKSLSTLAGICTNVLVYVAGIVTSAMNDALKGRNDH
jgi:hypothetical protein